MAGTDGVLSKKVPVSIPGSERPLGGLHPQGLPGFTDYFGTRFRHTLALFNGLTGHVLLFPFAGLFSSIRSLCLQRCDFIMRLDSGRLTDRKELDTKISGEQWIIIIPLLLNLFVY